MSNDDYTYVIVGEPKRDLSWIEENFKLPGDEDNRIVDSLASLTDAGEIDDVEYAASCLLYLARNKMRIYLTMPLQGLERVVLNKVTDLIPSFVYDEALEMLKEQVEGLPVAGPDDFVEAVGEAFDKHDVVFERIYFAEPEEDNEVRFHAPNRVSQMHTIKWCADGSVELDGAIMRPTAIMGIGHHQRELLGGGVLTPDRVLRFVANRMATNGPEDLIGYGRAFGPGREDHTNANLTQRSRDFRARGLVGVVTASLDRVSKGKPDATNEVAFFLREQRKGSVAEAIKALLARGVTGDLVPHAVLGDADALMVCESYVALHQQCKELYVGLAALLAFRAELLLDDKGKLVVVLFGKSTKHTRVDAGAYCLYTEDGGYITLPALIGMFEEGNDGSLYAPNALLDSVDGWLKERVSAVKDFHWMSPELIQRYYNSTVLVAEEDRIEPGAPLFEVDGKVHKWETKADYGIVRKVVDEASTKMVRVEIHIDAHFTRDLKIRGFGKGLVSSMEGAGMESFLVNTTGDESLPEVDKSPRVLVGAPGIIKDSKAANEYIVDPVPVVGSVKTEYCKRDYELMKLKHAPLVPAKQFEQPVPGEWVKTYNEGKQILRFHDKEHTIQTIDTEAIACFIRVQIEASPVGQSVGSSSMTMPQMAWLSSLPAGNELLKEAALKGVMGRTEALAYLHTVAGQLTREEA
jgi:hypothetical protein